MPVRKRNLKRRGDLSADERAWLDGEYYCGFIEFLPLEQLEALWESYGDHDAYVWAAGMYRPAAITEPVNSLPEAPSEGLT